MGRQPILPCRGRDTDMPILAWSLRMRIIFLATVVRKLFANVTGPMQIVAVLGAKIPAVVPS